jgi:hypothetical protein
MCRLGILLFLFTVLAAPAQAQWQAPAQAQWQTPVQGQPAPYGSVQPLDRILPGIRVAHPGRFSDAEGPFPDAAGGMHYRVKWLTPEGRVIWLDTDARTGRVIGPWAPGGRYPGMLPPMQRRFGPGGWGRGFGRGWPGRGRWPR